MKFCPNCGCSLSASPSAVAVVQIDPAEPPCDIAARESLTEKLKALAPTFEDLTDDRWGEWVDALPFNEFMEMIALGNEGIGKIIAEENHRGRKRSS